MGTICEISVPATSADEIDAAFNEIARIESFLSTWKHDSELSRVNDEAQRGPVRLSSELTSLLSEVLPLVRETGGAFNPLVGPSVRAWGTRGEPRRPAPAELERISAALDPANVRLEGGSLELRNGASLEEGAFGKGYALDRAVELLRASGVASATIDFGGQIAWYGSDLLEIAIAHPLARDMEAVVLSVPPGSISTSAGSQQTFLLDGRELTHIIDPRTGEPLPPRGSVTVHDASALRADVLSTALYVMGQEEGLAWAEARNVAALYLIPAGTELQIRTTSAFDSRVKGPRTVITKTGEE